MNKRIRQLVAASSLLFAAIPVCAAAATYSLGGTITGLKAGTYLTLTDNGSDTLTLSANGSFQFGARLAAGATYSVAVVTFPSGERCGVANATGKVANSNIANVVVTCAAPAMRLLAGALGGPGYVDGSRAVARLNNPLDVGVDQAGNLYIADNFNYTVRKVTPAGRVSTLAGSAGQPGTNDGKGTAARFSSPSALAVDPTGIVYVIDGGANTIRRISPTGNVTTLAGTPNVSGTNDGTGPAAQFWSPASIRLGASGSLYLTDNLRIRNISPAGVVTTLYSGFSPADDYFALQGLAVDSPEVIYCSTGTVNSLVKIDLAARVTSIVAGGINGPSGVSIAPHGTSAVGKVYFGDGVSALYAVNPNGSVSPFAGSAGQTGYVDGTGTAARFHYPNGMVMTSSGAQYVADSFNSSIREVTAVGVVTTVAGVPAHAGYVDAKGGAARFDYPRAMAVGRAGSIFVVDANATRMLTTAGLVTTAFPPQAGQQAFAVDDAGNMYFSRWVSNDIMKLTPTGQLTVVAGSIVAGYQDGKGAAAGFFKPNGVALDAAGNLYVADTNNFTIRKIAPTGQVTTLAGSAGIRGTTDGLGSGARFFNPIAVTVDAAGVVYVVDGYAIRKITTTGLVSTLAGSQTLGFADGTGAAAQFNLPKAIVVSPLGTVFVADTGNNEIRQITTSGVVTTVVGKHGKMGVRLGALPATLNTPVALAYVGSTLYVADAQEDSVLAVSGLF